MNYTYYHNPRCSKSRQGLEFLSEKGITPTIIEYLKVGLKKEEILEIQKKLNIKPLEGLIRTKEASFKEAGLQNKNLSTEEWIAEIVANPVLLERPILLNNTSAAIGRPIENFLKLI